MDDIRLKKLLLNFINRKKNTINWFKERTFQEKKEPNRVKWTEEIKIVYS